MIFALNLISQGTAAAQGSEGQSVDQFCFDLDDSKGMLRKLKEHPILLEENAALKEENTNLREQLSLKDALLEISEKRMSLQAERADFYQKMAEAEAKLADRYAEQNERLRKQLERKVFWEKVGSVILIAVGVAIGLAF